MPHPRVFASLFFVCTALQAQQALMPAMSMTPRSSLIENELDHTESGTSIEPASTPSLMLMSQHGHWTLMLHGVAFVSEIQQQAANDRGGDKLFSTNWIMPMATHPLGHGQITVRTMLSLEPATISGRFYPELFQQGETAFGKPIVNGQHPHNLFMELGALYDLHLTERTLLSLYAAPVGDPAIGPTAYPHRLSASEDPIAPLSHHQQDSTHVAYSVLTAGLTYNTVRLEASGFHGAEPDENRWTFAASPNGHALDSYSGRLTWSPSANISAQYSAARITSPEALNAGEDQRRQTASVLYTRGFGAHQSMPGMTMRGDHGPTGFWSTSLIYGHTHAIPTGTNQDSYLAESLLHWASRNNLWTRIESASRTSELLNSATDSPLGHVQAVSLGFDRDFAVGPHLSAAPGAQYTQYRTPDALAPAYGRMPYGVVAFVRLRVK